MTRRFYKHIAENKGDIYIQMLFFIVFFMFLLILVMQLFSVFAQKIWLDEQLDDIVTLIAYSGDIPEAADEYMMEIATRLGGTSVFTYTRNDNNDTMSCTYTWDEEVQEMVETRTVWSVNEEMPIGTTVTLHYTNDKYRPISISSNSWMSEFHINSPIDVIRTSIVTARGVIP